MRIEEIIKRRVEKILPSKKDFIEALKKRKLKIYWGVDPTSPELHLGHSVPLLLLKEFQKMGHKIIILIGDFTAKIGDPTGKLSCRKALSDKEIKKNLKTYKDQISKILDFKKNPPDFLFNSKWFSKMKLPQFFKILSKFTLSRLLERDMFQKRIKLKKEIYLHEFLYPLLQGYDSVMIDCDVEIGASDQLFNMMIGRKLLKEIKGKEKFVVTTPLLVDPRTGKKFSKSEKNYISLQEKPKEMFGKIMNLPDEGIIPFLKLCTEVPLVEVEKIEKKLSKKEINPKEVKKFLAFEIVKMYYGKKLAKKAKEEFERVFEKKEKPKEIEKIQLKEKEIGIVDLLLKVKFASSKSEAKRLIKEGAIKIENEKISNPQKKIKIKKGMILKKGKRFFVEIT